MPYRTVAKIAGSHSRLERRLLRRLRTIVQEPKGKERFRKLLEDHLEAVVLLLCW